jgi:hypothetical protein
MSQAQGSYRLSLHPFQFWPPHARNKVCQAEHSDAGRWLDTPVQVPDVDATVAKRSAELSAFILQHAYQSKQIKSKGLDAATRAITADLLSEYCRRLMEREFAEYTAPSKRTPPSRPYGCFPHFN